MTITEAELDALEGGEPRVNVQIRDVVTRLHAHLNDMAELAGAPRPDRSAWLSDLPPQRPVFCMLRAPSPFEGLTATLYAPAGLPEDKWAEIQKEGYLLWRPVAVTIRGEPLATHDLVVIRSYLNALADCVVFAALGHGYDVRIVPAETIYWQNIELD